jgi:hypothetical protein
MGQAVLSQHQATWPVTNHKPMRAEWRKTALKREQGPSDGAGNLAQVAHSEPVTRQIPDSYFASYFLQSTAKKPLMG